MPPMSSLPDPINSFRYPKPRRSRHGATPYPREFKKCFVGGLFMCFNFLATTVSLSITHERVPNQEPLPDIGEFCPQEDACEIPVPKYSNRGDVLEADLFNFEMGQDFCRGMAPPTGGVARRSNEIFCSL